MGSNDIDFVVDAGSKRAGGGRLECRQTGTCRNVFCLGVIDAEEPLAFDCFAEISVVGGFGLYWFWHFYRMAARTLYYR
jgi:hypothetical protein